ncbi:MAG: transglutaminase domain-containing protein [Candidatus Limnocylindrales bacterium]
MATAGLTQRGRSEVFRPRGPESELDERSVIVRAYERMHPDEGWTGLALVLLLTGTMAWSIADARWILGRDGLTSFLIWIALAAALWGYVSARLRISPWLAHALGCTIGAFVVIEVVGSVLPGSTPTLGGWLRATADSVSQAYLDLSWRHQLSTLQFGHFCLILGIVVWGTAQAASYDVFGYHRSVNGVLLLAVVLVANMSLTLHDQLPALVLFSAAALALLLLSHAADERSAWLRHRIWRGRDMQAPHLQGGVVFASLAVCGALILTTVASSAPLAGPLQDAGSNLADALSGLSGYFPNGGASRYQPSSDFGNTSPISASFHAGPGQVFTVRVSSGSVAYHWRLISYDTFQSTGWSVGAAHDDQIIAGGTLDAGTLDQVGPTTPGRRQVSFVVHVQDASIKHLIVANEPDSVNVAVRRTLLGSVPSSANVVGLATDATDYTVFAYVPDEDPTGAGLTEWRLRNAGGDYPPGLLGRFTQGASLVGSNGQNLLAQITDWAHSQGNGFDNEYDAARAIQDYLRSDRFTYTSDITAEMPKCGGLSTVDCFALVKRGFCEQYATTMTMLMRMAGYPARYVLGYLPGAIAQNTLLQQVTGQQKHAWVEVYFPTYGWIPFDPTGGVGQPTVLPPGSAVAPTPTPAVSLSPEGTAARPTGPAGGGEGAVPPSGDGGLVGLLIPSTAGGVVAFGLLLLWLRRPRPLGRPESVYRSVVKLASRLGYPPQPTQTVYEYTGMLADVVPQARESLGIVATAAVEVTYGKQQLSSERLVFLSTAHRLVRQALLRLAFKWPRLRGRKPQSGGPGATVRRR